MCINFSVNINVLISTCDGCASMLKLANNMTKIQHRINLNILTMDKMLTSSRMTLRLQYMTYMHCQKPNGYLDLKEMAPKQQKNIWSKPWICEQVVVYSVVTRVNHFQNTGVRISLLLRRCNNAAVYLLFGERITNSPAHSNIQRNLATVAAYAP